MDRPCGSRDGPGQPTPAACEALTSTTRMARISHACGAVPHGSRVLDTLHDAPISSGRIRRPGARIGPCRGRSAWTSRFAFPRGRPTGPGVRTNVPVAVRLVDVVKRFGDLVAVDHIDLDVEDGEFFSLLGPSGCGKTTTLRMIGGFEPPTSGRIELQGEDVTWLPPYKRHVNTVFQNYALFPHLTIYENVAFGLRRKGTPDPEVKT